MSVNKYLQVHPFFQYQSFDEFCLNIPAFYFRDQVPDDVIQNFAVVEKLLAFSYYEYKFIDEAFAKAIHTLEMAMNIRYKELNLLSQKGKLGFNSLIRSLTTENCFDTDLEVLVNVKELRNHFSHPERHSFGGTFYWNQIEFVARLINELYEDVSLRLERRRLASDCKSSLEEFHLDHYVLMRRGQSEPVLLFSANLLWINNKLTPNTYLMQCTPLFDLTYETEYQVNNPRFFGLKIIELAFTETGMVAIDADTGETIVFSGIPPTSAYMNIFQRWKSDYDNIPWNAMYERCIQMNFSQLLVPELQGFQKL